MAGSVIGVLLAGEVLVRLFNLGPPVYVSRRFEPNNRVPFMRIPNGPILYQPNTVFSSVYDPAGDQRDYFGPDGRVRYQINQYGLRGPAIEREKPSGAFRIVCLGDSFTFGEGVKYPDTYPARLQKELAETVSGRHVEVINAGVQTYNTADEAALYLLRCAAFHPDVVTLEFFLNDATDGAETIRQHEAWTDDWELSALSKVSRLWEILDRARYSRRWQMDYFQSTRDGFKSQRWTDCQEVLRGMKKISEEDDFRFVVVLFPILWGLDEDYPFEDIHKMIAQACTEAEIDFIDLLDVYRGRPAKTLWVHPTDHHPNEIAHRLAAHAISQYLLRG